MSDARVYYFGPWGEPGHFWYAPGGRWVTSDEQNRLSLIFGSSIDGGYAPREWRGDCFVHRSLVPDPSCCFAAQGKDDEEKRRIRRDTNECRQGAYLIHHIKGWTLMSWWDRSQGDTRSACNASIAAYGTFEAEQMFELLCEHFPSVVRNLAKAGVVVHDVKVKNGQ